MLSRDHSNFKSEFHDKNGKKTVDSIEQQPAAEVVLYEHLFLTVRDYYVAARSGDPGTESHRQQEFGFANDHCSSCATYILATGCSDGSLKLWKSNRGDPPTLNLPWELVGMFIAHHSPVKGICYWLWDTVPIRTVAWAPFEGDPESSNIVIIVGHEGLKFWDLRNPFRPLRQPPPSSIGRHT
ncbi:hypothetical protein KIW84_061986 [Lathyrus oleraceus]|uniref:Uncharacterized protein n=1 Tax=Pisum sativum TaxID=3888 RepID=A0A9D4W5W6_PEA|nr:hypothetical protein KIW84_061986 [Pisum sativum]